VLGGCRQEQAKEDAASGVGAVVNPAEDQPEAEEPVAVPQPEGFAQLTFKLVDKLQALTENPQLVVVENKTNASDPWSAAAQSYFTLGSKASLIALKHGIDLHKAQYDKPPTFAEFESLYRQAGVEFKGLYPWQTYAYDAEAGTVCILEDRAEKARMHKEKGVPYEPEEQGQQVQQ